MAVNNLQAPFCVVPTWVKIRKMPKLALYISKHYEEVAVNNYYLYGYPYNGDGWGAGYPIFYTLRGTGTIFGNNNKERGDGCYFFGTGDH